MPTAVTLWLPLMTKYNCNWPHNAYMLFIIWSGCCLQDGRWGRFSWLTVQDRCWSGSIGVHCCIQPDRPGLSWNHLERICPQLFEQRSGELVVVFVWRNLSHPIVSMLHAVICNIATFHAHFASDLRLCVCVCVIRSANWRWWTSSGCAWSWHLVQSITLWETSYWY